MKAKDIKVGEHYLLVPYSTHEIKFLVDKVEKTERRSGWSRGGGDTRVFGRIVNPDTDKATPARSDGYPLSKIVAPWNEERYINLKQADENRRYVDAEDAKTAALLIEALEQKGCRSEFRLDRGVVIPRSSMGALLELIRSGGG